VQLDRDASDLTQVGGESFSGARLLSRTTVTIQRQPHHDQVDATLRQADLDRSKTGSSRSALDSLNRHYDAVLGADRDAGSTSSEIERGDYH
jgi:hypothetical protein